MRKVSRVLVLLACVVGAACAKKPASSGDTSAQTQAGSLQGSSGSAAPGTNAKGRSGPRTQSNLVAFRSYDDVRSFLKTEVQNEKDHQAELRRKREEARRADAGADAAKPILKSGEPWDAGPGHKPAIHFDDLGGGVKEASPARRSADPAPAAAAPATAAKGDAKGTAATSITNNQHAGVDEGDIVKLFGKHLVVLRRGRIFSLRIEDKGIVPVDRVDAFGPDLDPSGTWYDEMLISDHKLVVIGFSYARGGTEVGFFDLDDAGHVKYRSTYHFRSNDYYSARNYSSRLIGDKLVFYMPLYLNPYADDPVRDFPANRRWHAGATVSEFKTIGDGSHVYRPQTLEGMPRALHSVVTCDISGADPACDARSVLGSYSRTFYVSPSAVYVWTQDYRMNEQGSAARVLANVFQLPLDGGAPAKLPVSGAPVDQFSFLEGDDENLNVVVRAQGNGDAMWQTEARSGTMAALRLPLSRFDGADEPVPAAFYTELPPVTGWSMQNRFVGDTLLYGEGNSWGYAHDDHERRVFAYRYKDKSRPHAISLDHGVDRIEPMGKNALVVGGDGKDLHFTTLRLGGDPARAATYVRQHASQGELRSHGFFYRGDSELSGVMGLPVRGEREPGYAHLMRDSAYILFLKSDALKLGELGQLGSNLVGQQQDGCRASCVDWYGNARPIFVGDRVFALLGYELVEGKIDGRIKEIRRANFSPPAAPNRVPANDYDD